MMIPEKPNIVCSECGKMYEYKKNEEFEPEFMFGSVGGMWHRAMYWTKIINGHEDCIKAIDERLLMEKEREIAEKTQRKIESMFRSCNIPEHIVKSRKFENFDINSDNERAFSILTTWSPSDKWGVFLQGTAGTGKSHLLIALANKWMKKQHPAFFMNVSDMFDDLKSGYSDNSYQIKMQTLKNVEILILDDIGTEKPTDWVEEKLFQLLNHRMNEGLATFFSSNCTLMDLKTRLHERITSRIKEMSVVVPLNGKDMRNIVYEQRLIEIEQRLRREPMDQVDSRTD